jgi:hypothetical protein
VGILVLARAPRFAHRRAHPLFGARVVIVHGLGRRGGRPRRVRHEMWVVVAVEEVRGGAAGGWWRGSGGAHGTAVRRGPGAR